MWRDQLPGGKADHKKPSDFSSKALQQGKITESEHTSDPHIAEEITMDHLSEMPDYYDRLRRMERKARLVEVLTRKQNSRGQ